MTEPTGSQNQKKAAYLKASLIAAVAIVGIAGLFAFWSDRSAPKKSAESIQHLDEMESKGIPLISAKTLDGQTVSTTDFGGKLLIVNFWASWCEPCVAEIPSLVSLVKTFSGQVVLLAVSADNSREDIDAFLKSFPELKNENIHLVWDETHSIMDKYGTERLPESYIVGKDGKLVKKIVGSINWHTPSSEAFVKEFLSK